MKLSVIIPVYNVEATLDRCVASIVVCKLQDVEIILVDDGSPDRCGDLCDQWAKKDTRITVIHKSNGGLSDARNAGIEAATGDYLTFVDSDDYLGEGTLESLMEMAARHPECDLIEYPINQFEGAPNEQLLTFPDKTYTNISQYWYEARAYAHAYAVNKVYRRKLFHEVRYPVGKVFEDIFTLPHLLQAASAVGTCSCGLYHYCHNQQGITSKASGRELLMLLDAHMQITEMPAFTAYADPLYYLHLVNIQISANEFSGVPPILEDRPYYDKRNLKSVILYLIGIKRLCTLNRLYRKIVKRR